MGANGPSIPNEVILTLRAITDEIREALKGTLPAVLLLEREYFTNDRLPGHLGVAGWTYEDLISIVLGESNMPRVDANTCVQVHTYEGWGAAQKYGRATEQDTYHPIGGQLEEDDTYQSPKQRHQCG